MPLSGSPKEIVHEEMHRFKHGELHSGSSHGPKVKNRAQAVAIALSEARKHRAMGGPTINPAMMQIARPMPQAGLGATPMSMPTMGLAHRAAGGLTPAPWFVRQESRNMMHTGPILSAVPGRTDRHEMSVPSGSYVLPAETISHLGQSNSISGLKIANNMFGASGPYGVGIPHLGHGAGLPKPPRPMSDKGGARGEGDGSPVDVITAGGEYIIPPQVVERIGDGDLKRGHKILDSWVMSVRKDHLRTLKKLKPPAKS